MGRTSCGSQHEPAAFGERAFAGDVTLVRQRRARDGLVANIVLAATVMPFGVEADDDVGAVLQVLFADVEIRDGGNARVVPVPVERLPLEAQDLCAIR